MSASAFRPLTSLLPRTQRRTLARMSIIGRLAATPELSTTSTGREMVKYALGVNSGPRDNSDTSWFRITSFPVSDGQRDFLLRQEKGQQMWVDADGRLAKYEVGEGAQKEKRTRLELLQRSFEVLAPSRQQTDTSAQEAAAASHGAEAGDEALR